MPTFGIALEGQLFGQPGSETTVLEAKDEREAGEKAKRQSDLQNPVVKEVKQLE